MTNKQKINLQFNFTSPHLLFLSFILSYFLSFFLFFFHSFFLFLSVVFFLAWIIMLFVSLSFHWGTNLFNQSCRIGGQARQRRGPNRGFPHNSGRERRCGEFDPRGTRRLHAHHLPHHRARYCGTTKCQNYANYHQTHHLREPSTNLFMSRRRDAYKAPPDICLQFCNSHSDKQIFSRGHATLHLAVSVRPTVPNFFVIRAVFVLRPLPNHPRLSCRVYLIHYH